MSGANPTLDLLHARKSVRAYEARPVEAAVRQALLEATVRAPTAGNLQLYSILEVNDPEIKRRLSVSCDNQPFIATAPLVLLFLADYQRWMDYWELSGALAPAGPRPRESDLILALEDALIAAQTCVVAAEALGLGSCYIGDILERWEEHRDLLDLPPYAFPATLLTLGYPTEQQRRRAPVDRLPLEGVLHEDRYRRLDQAGYGRLFQGKDQGPFLAGAANYGQHQFRRKFDTDYSREMRRSVAAALGAWRGGDTRP